MNGLLPVSAILAVHDIGPAAVPELVERVRRLAERARQVVVVDDGSRDGSGPLLEQALSDLARVELIRLEENRGVAHARNLALAQAGSTYVWFADWDDRWAPDLLDRLVARAEETDADVVVCRAEHVDETTGRRRLIDGLAEERVMDGAAALRLVLAGRIQGYLWSKLLRREVLPVPMFPLQRSQSDFGGLVPVVAAARRVATVPEVLVEHLVRPGSLTNSRDPDLELLRRSREVVHRCAAAKAHDGEWAADLLRYDYEHWHVARAVTAARLFGDRGRAAGVARESARAMRWRETVRLVRTDRRTAARSCLVKVAGPRLPWLYDRYVGLRRAGARR